MYCNDEDCDKCYEAGVVPIFTYAHITNSLKRELLGQSLSYIIKRLEDETKGYEYIDYLYNSNIISKKTYDWRRRK